MSEIIQESKSMVEFKSGVDELLEKRSYFISQVLPKLVEGQDYYTIKGRKSLAKGGSEKIASIYGYTAQFERDDEAMSAFSIKGLIAFVCDLYKGEAHVGQGRGASTLEKNENDPNKTLKMAQKSSFIDAVIRTSGLSDIFTQDLESLAPQRVSEAEINPSGERDIEGRDKQVSYEDYGLPKFATEKQKVFLKTLIADKCTQSAKEEYTEKLNSPYLTRFDCSEMISSLLPMR
jgi:hypothetical protein